jgi:membrane protein DedA with SNARE-associated domain
MPDIVRVIVEYGYQSLFLALFLEAVGLPVPAAVALLAAGAACSAGGMRMAVAFPVAMLGMLTGDTVLYTAGRYMGWGLLSFLCGLSLNPEACIFRSAKWFYERGRATLLIAKFIPGINTMAPPLAGSMNMRPAEFYRFDVAGVAIYVLAYGAAGYLFHGILRAIVGSLQAFSTAAEWLLLIAIVAYIAQRGWIYARQRSSRHVRRVKVSEVAARQDKDSTAIIIADVRSHGYYDAGEQRVRGSIRLEPNNLDVAIATLPKGAEIYLYCT